MMGSSKSTVIISCINVHILFSTNDIDVISQLRFTHLAGNALLPFPVHEQPVWLIAQTGVLFPILRYLPNDT